MKTAALILLLFGLSGCRSDQRPLSPLERFQRLSGLFRHLSNVNATVSRDSVSLKQVLSAGKRSSILRSAAKTARDASKLDGATRLILARLARIPGTGMNRVVRRYLSLVTQSVRDQRAEAVHIRNAMAVLRSDPYLLDSRVAARFLWAYSRAQQAAHRATRLVADAAYWRAQYARKFRYVPVATPRTSSA